MASEHAKDLGKFILTAGKYFSDKEEDKGKVTCVFMGISGQKGFSYVVPKII